MSIYVHCDYMQNKQAIGTSHKFINKLFIVIPDGEI